jgi:Beta/Gamma crystallin
MPLTETTKTSPGTDEVIFFINENYSGKAYLSKLGDRVNIWKEYLSLNDKLNSVKVGSSCSLTVYQDDGFGGASQVLVTDTPKINVSGMSSFIVLDKHEGEHAVSFTFKDTTSEGRRMTLKSTNFPEGGENGVTQPNPTPTPGVDPNVPRVFAILKDSNGENTPIVIAIYVRKESGEYEDMGAAMYIYWQAGKAHIKELPDYGHPKLHHTQEGPIIHFSWG